MPIRIFANSGENVDVELQKSYGFMNYSHLHTRYELYFCPQKLKQHIVVNSEEYYPEKPCAVLCAPYILHAMSSATRRSKNIIGYVFISIPSFLTPLPTGICRKN